MGDSGRSRSTPFRRIIDHVARIYLRFQQDRVSLIAGGVSFYFLLSLFPALGAFVATFGYFANIGTVASEIDGLRGIVPAGGLDMIETQLVNLAAQDKNALSIGLVFGFAIAFWTANNGVKALFQALNVAHELKEKRSFLQINLLAFAFTFGTMFVATVLVAIVGIVPALLALLERFSILSELTEYLIDASRWPTLLILSFAAITILFRFGPNRQKASRRWVTLGAVLATLVWIVASAGFSYYLRNFANYNATYGSLGAVVGFLLWTWLSTVILIVGALIDAELEHDGNTDPTKK